MTTKTTTDLAKAYRPADVEPEIAARWDAADAFHAEPSDSGDPYCIVIPPPNITAALHMGHALNNTLQDILIRYHRMLGHNTLWMPGTDHAGIATQTVVEKRVLAEEGKRRTDFQRDEFVAKIQAWKVEYEAQITAQLKAMGCSCDWNRQRFTMDPVCAEAVREAFYRLFKDGLIYRGKRLVNWDPATQTALADDEVEMRDIDGHFWYLRYPLEDGTGHVTVATTRPETMLGDTAVAINPNDPKAPALRGKKVRLPIVNRIIPIVEDEYVVLPDPDGDEKSQYSSGYLKVTPAHDPNDYEIGQKFDLPIINVMAPDASISDQHGWEDVGGAEFVLGLDRYEARESIIDWFRENGLLEDVKPYRHTVGLSYRSHVPIEPYLSDQWYVKVTDDRLAAAALHAMAPEQRSMSHDLEETEIQPWHGKLRFTPERYAKTFQSWHTNIRDWCISRQLWWGHRIPVWTVKLNLLDINENFPAFSAPEGQKQYAAEFQRRLDQLAQACAIPNTLLARIEWVEEECMAYICTRNSAADDCMSRLKTYIPRRETEADGDTALRFEDNAADVAAHAVVDMIQLVDQAIRRDPDVLDTWFSSALWPFSTLGWPNDTEALRTWNPSNLLCTAREIITLWVSRMVMTNLYLLDQLPFTDVFIHAMIQDGDGRKMSKSLGNGVNPLDIIHSHGADAMRFTLASMTTNTQDVRMPVTHDAETDRNTSEKFDIGRNFANKLWNAARFALSNLDPSPTLSDQAGSARSLADRWVLSRLAATIHKTDNALNNYEFSQYAQGLYDFFWRDFCDWYIEAAKPTVKDDAAQQAVFASCLDAVLRLLHPAMPFITEKLWQRLNEVIPQRGIVGLTLPQHDLLIHAPWPKVSDTLTDNSAESLFELVRELVTAIRVVRTEHKIPPRQKVDATLKTSPDVASQLTEQKALIETLANVAVIDAGQQVNRPEDTVAASVGQIEIYLHGLVNAEAERDRLAKRLEEVEKSIKTLQGRLSNKAYVDKAPDHLVQQTRDQLDEQQEQAETLRTQIAALG